MIGDFDDKLVGEQIHQMAKDAFPNCTTSISRYDGYTIQVWVDAHTCIILNIRRFNQVAIYGVSFSFYDKASVSQGTIYIGPYKPHLIKMIFKEHKSFTCIHY